jgi:DNA invertase Pin-like site-specific DNA recombinase
MKRLNFIHYLRKSTEEEGTQLLSIQGRRPRLESVAAETGYITGDTIIKHESTKQPEPPSLQQMIEKISEKQTQLRIKKTPNS